MSGKFTPLPTAMLVGQTFNFLTVKKSAGSSAYKEGHQWLCVCVCEKERVVTTKALKRGSVKSCGCKNQVSRLGRPSKKPQPFVSRSAVTALNDAFGNHSGAPL